MLCRSGAPAAPGGPAASGGPAAISAAPRAAVAPKREVPVRALLLGGFLLAGLVLVGFEAITGKELISTKPTSSGPEVVSVHKLANGRVSLAVPESWTAKDLGTKDPARVNSYAYRSRDREVGIEATTEILADAAKRDLAVVLKIVQAGWEKEGAKCGPSEPATVGGKPALRTFMETETDRGWPVKGYLYVVQEGVLVVELYGWASILKYKGQLPVVTAIVERTEIH